MSESQHGTQFAIAILNYAIIEFGIHNGQTLTSGYVVELQLLALIRGFIPKAFHLQCEMDIAGKEKWRREAYDHVIEETIDMRFTKGRGVKSGWHEACKVGVILFLWPRFDSLHPERGHP